MPSCCKGLESKRQQIENTQEKLDKIRVVSAESWKDKTDASCQQMKQEVKPEEQ